MMSEVQMSGVARNARVQSASGACCIRACANECAEISGKLSEKSVLDGRDGIEARLGVRSQS